MRRQERPGTIPKTSNSSAAKAIRLLEGQAMQETILQSVVQCSSDRNGNISHVLHQTRTRSGLSILSSRFVQKGQGSLAEYHL